jgi:hypothetical protein
MAYKAVVGKVGGLYANNFNASVFITGQRWFQVQPASSASILTIAADARRADIPVVVVYEDTNSMVYEIQTL